MHGGRGESIIKAVFLPLISFRNVLPIVERRYNEIKVFLLSLFSQCQPYSLFLCRMFRLTAADKFSSFAFGIEHLRQQTAPAWQREMTRLDIVVNFDS